MKYIFLVIFIWIVGMNIVDLSNEHRAKMDAVNELNLCKASLKTATEQHETDLADKEFNNYNTFFRGYFTAARDAKKLSSEACFAQITSNLQKRFEHGPRIGYEEK